MRHSLQIACLLLASSLGGLRAGAQDSKTWMNKLVQNEESANGVRGRYEYMSEERSDRTGGHLWVERVVETPVGRVRLLLAEDGQPISGDRVAAERARLAKDAANPDDFAKRESNNDDAHARQMLTLLPKAFLLDAPVEENGGIRIHFTPNPDYQPQSMEERVLHGMHGSVLIDRQMVRLREVDGRTDADISLGFGPFAIIKAGSNFQTQRMHEDGPDWKTATAHTDIMGRALMLKSLARRQDVKRWNYRKVGTSLSVADAVALVEQNG